MYNRRKIAFDIVCIDRYITVKHIDWNFVKQFYNVIDTEERLIGFKSLNFLTQLNPQELNKILKSFSIKEHCVEKDNPTPSQNLVIAFIKKIFNPLLNKFYR